MPTAPTLRRGLAAAALAATAVLALPGVAVAQTPGVSANPNSGAPGSSFTLTLSGFDTLPQCNPSPSTATRQTCIYVDFIQGSRTTNVAVASGSNEAVVKAPPACTAGQATGCVDPGAGTIKATSPNGQTASTGFTVTGTGPTTSSSTTSTTKSTTTTSSSSTTSSTSSSTTSSSTTSTSELTRVTTPLKPKKASHSDIPRYIAVALVVLAAAATAAVDTRLRRLAPPGL